MPFVMEVSMTGITELGKKLNSLSGHNSVERDRLYTNVLSELGKVLVPRLKLETPVGATHHLADSTDSHITITQDPETNDTVYQLIVTQGARSPSLFTYRPIVVRGRLPGRIPPSLVLRSWVQLNWGLTSIQAEKGAFRLARHIAAFGTKSNPYVSRVVRASRLDITKAANDLGQQLSVEIMDF